MGGRALWDPFGVRRVGERFRGARHDRPNLGSVNVYLELALRVPSNGAVSLTALDSPE
jgi:hypothetical protein